MIVPFCDVNLLHEMSAHARTSEVLPLQGLDKSCLNFSSTEEQALCQEGKVLFNNKLWQGGKRTACASCHSSAAFTRDLNPNAEQDALLSTSLKVPSLLDLGAVKGPFFWNGRAPSLETQPLWPLLSPLEMSVPLVTLEQFGGAIHVGKKIGKYVSSLKTGPSAFDKMVTTKTCDSISSKEWEGATLLFDTYKCQSCHEGREFRSEYVVKISYDHLPPNAFSEGEATYALDAPLYSKPTLSQIKISSIAPSLRNLTFRSQGRFGRFSQFQTLESYLIDHWPRVLKSDKLAKLPKKHSNKTANLEASPRAGEQKLKTDVEKISYFLSRTLTSPEVQAP